MVKKVKLPLILNGAACRTISDVQENWDMEEIYNCFIDGKLLTWCRERRYIQADKIAGLSTDDPAVRKKICEIFEVEYNEAEFVGGTDWEPTDPDEIEKLNELKKITDDKNILKNFRQAAFDRDELIDLLDEEVDEIYLCNNTFEDFPIADENKTYIGVGKAVAVIPSKQPVDFGARNIKFVNVEFDDAYKKIAGNTYKNIVDENLPDKWFRIADEAEKNKDYAKAVEYYSKAVEQNHIKAMDHLAGMYFDGLGVEKNPDKGLKLMKTGAELGDADMMFALGAIYSGIVQEEKIVPTNYVEAFKWTKKAVEAGSIYALTLLGHMYRFGDGTEKNENKAFELYKKSADNGESDGMNLVGLMYLEGIGIQQDDQKAVEWFQKAVDKGNETAMGNLALLYLDGKGVKKDEVKAFNLFQKVAESGKPDAMYFMGMMYLHGEGTQQVVYKGINWLEKAAELGNTDAMMELGEIYRNGDFEVTADATVAFKWYMKAAEAGNAEAMNTVGFMYDNSEGVAQNKNQALEWYQKAADLGNTDAMYNIGYYYEILDHRNWSVAKEWYKKAADLGDTHAMCKIGTCYVSEAKWDTAETYFKKALDKGYKPALTYLGDLYSKLGDYPGRPPSDYQTALRYYIQSAAEGDANAMYKLGVMNYEGRGVNKNKKIAIQWLEKAVAKGHRRAEELLKQIKDCFITAAVCESFNKPDDCFELTIFRNFRDDWLALQSDGKNLIEEYYKIAPQIVANINKLTNANEIYKKLWYDWLSPCLEFIKVGDNIACKNKYVEMVQSLKKLYL